MEKRKKEKKMNKGVVKGVAVVKDVAVDKEREFAEWVKKQKKILSESGAKTVTLNVYFDKCADKLLSNVIKQFEKQENPNLRVKTAAGEMEFDIKLVKEWLSLNKNKDSFMDVGKMVLKLFPLGNVASFLSTFSFPKIKGDESMKEEIQRFYDNCFSKDGTVKLDKDLTDEELTDKDLDSEDLTDKDLDSEDSSSIIGINGQGRGRGGRGIFRRRRGRGRGIGSRGWGRHVPRLIFGSMGRGRGRWRGRGRGRGMYLSPMQKRRLYNRFYSYIPQRNTPLWNNVISEYGSIYYWLFILSTLLGTKRGTAYERAISGHYVGV